MSIPAFAQTSITNEPITDAERYLIYQSVVNNFNSQPQPYWTSGNEENNYGNHGLIAMMGISIADSNSAIDAYFESNRTQWLIEYSIMPDIEERDNYTFSGHFYGENGKNYLGGSTTAYTRFRDHYNNAVVYYNSGNYLESTRSLGRAIHYISDINNPHHSSNAIAGASNHTAFEAYVEEARESNVVNPAYITTSYLNGFTNKSLKTIADESATFSRGYYSLANAGYPLTLDRSRAVLAINPTFCNSQKVAAGVIYKFCKEVGMF